VDINKKIEKINSKLSLRKFDEVISECKKLININPDTGVVYNLAGLAFQAKKKHKESFNYFIKATELDKKDFAAKINLANAYMYLDDYNSSEKLFSKLLLEKPDDYLLIANYANFKKKIRDFKSAIKLYEEALKKSNYKIFIMKDLAKIYSNTGEFEKSKELYEKILTTIPNSIDSHVGLSRLINYKENQIHLDQMMQTYKNKDLKDNDKALLAFAISKAYEDKKDYEKSYFFFNEGNQLINSNLNYNFENEKKIANNIKKIFVKLNYDVSKKISMNKKIIFVCGLPRSGTTLVEQILSSHKDASGIGEVEYLEKGINEIYFQDNKILNHKLIEDIHKGNNLLEEFYLKKLKKLNFNSAVLIDKTPHNFRWIGFIKLFFPNSKVVLCKRNLDDNFLSLYKNYFASTKHMGWSFDPEYILKYIDMYRQLISFWRDKYPEFIYELEYENLVKDNVNQIKKLIDKCGLPWDQNCLSHYKNRKGTINTVSIIQARKPIYSSSLNFSSLYDKYLSKYYKRLKS
jgi:tetratricopeptide (TPR) repeat protein|tara:strand:- start:4189 stop:5742 length:1554 start_codon:yes stop_codon:yes gene_type:complete